MKTHPLNVSYLVVGLAFLGIAGSWALRATGVIDTADVGWLVPLSLVLAGAIGLAAFAAKGMSRRRTPAAAGYAPPIDTYDTVVETYDPPMDTYDEPVELVETDDTAPVTGIDTDPHTPDLPEENR